MGRKNTFVICGKGFIGSDAVRYLIQKRIISSKNTKLYILPVAEDSGIDTWEPSLKKVALDLHLPIIRSLKDIPLTSNDMVLSLEYNKIIRTSEICLARAYNIHFSDLPKYRGCLTSVWPIRNGETYAGVTLHEMVEPVDSGNIVDQMRFLIPNDATSYDLYMLYTSYGLTLFKKNIRKLLSGRVVSHPQDSSKITYFSRTSVDFRNTEITDFSQPATIVSRYIRSLIFEPYQLPTFKGRRIKKVRVLKNIHSMNISPSSVLLKNDKEAIIVCVQGRIRLLF